MTSRLAYYWLALETICLLLLIALLLTPKPVLEVLTGGYQVKLERVR